MSRKLEEILGLPPMDAAEVAEVTEEECELLEDASNVVSAMSSSEKIDLALSSVSGLSDHDREMDDIATKAIKSYEDLCHLGLGVSDAHSGRIFEVAATMLKTAMDARDAKVNRKLKTIELQLKKARLDFDTTGSRGAVIPSANQEFDRNELLEYFKNGGSPPTADETEAD